MKAKTIFRKAAVIILSAMLFTACGKEGPAGPQGEQGPKGDKGATGAKGATGTANVIYSDWMKVTFINNGSGLYQADIKVPKLTQDILDHGDIEVYVKSAYIFKLPLTASPPDYLMAAFRVGDITLQTNYVGYTSFQYRYIIIPGGVHARRSTPLPDLKDYHAVCQYYGIPE